MPIVVDHERRRSELAEAVWRVVCRDGVRAASVRVVAREAGLSVGSVRHFFTTQDELLHFAMREVLNRARARAAASLPTRLAHLDAGNPADAVVDLLEQALPLDAARATEMRVWLAFVGYDAVDPEVRAIRKELDEEVRRACEHAVSGLASIGALGEGRDVEVETRLLWALLDGLALRALLDADSLAPEDTLEALRTHVRQLATPAAIH